MRKKKLKLSLNRETIRGLDQGVEMAAGAATAGPVCQSQATNCMSNCPGCDTVKCGGGGNNTFTNFAGCSNYPICATGGACSLGC